MSALKGGLIVLSVFALSGSAHRVIRSPDKIEVNVPDHSYERESGEYQENMTEEAAYWHGQGDQLGDKEKQGQEQLEQDREKNEENYEHEKNHYEEQQINYQTELNETYQEDREKAESHHESNYEHYNTQHHNDNNYNFQTQGNKTAEELTETETADRYEEKGTEYTKEGKENMENYDVNRDSPSISYTKT